MKLWLIKYKNRRVEGPLSAEDIQQLIAEKVVDGEVLISTYPEGRWKPISVEPDFYSALLEVLSTGGENKNKNKKKTEVQPPVQEEEESSATVVMDLNEKKALYGKRKNKRRGIVKKSSLEETVIQEVPFSDEGSTQEAISTPAVELSPPGKGEKLSPPPPPSHKGRRKKRIILLGALAIGVLFFFLPEGSKTVNSKKYIQLKQAKIGKPTNLKDKGEEEVKKALGQYFKGTGDSYIKAQDLFLQAVEKNPSNTYNMALLCLVYFELWPFTKKSFQEEKVLSYLVSKVAVLNKRGVRSGLCNVVNLLIKGHYEKALTVLSGSLSALDSADFDKESQKLTPLFYYLKAQTFNSLGDLSNGLSYLNTLHKILPNWITPYILAGDILLKQKKPSQALSYYKKALKLNPNHKTAKIKLSLLEYQFFRKEELAKKNLEALLIQPGQVSPLLLSNMYLTLAQIILKKGKSIKALKYAEQSYRLNPASQLARDLLVKIGGEEQLKETKVDSGMLVQEGDRLFNNNKISDALEYYEKAFKIDRNISAAIKIAESYWALNFYKSAIQWLKKAINADPSFVKAYVLMAQYYSDRYDFSNAEKILKIGFKQIPKSYELYRGRAYLALKRHNYNRAIQYANLAVRIYEADVESYVILSSAYTKLGNANEALASAVRGLELDLNAPKIQVAYAKALGAVYDKEAGIDYFRKILKQKPLDIKFRMELVRYLFQSERYGQVKQELKYIFNMDPKYEVAHFYLGRSLMKEGNLSVAYESFLQSAVLNPSDPKATFYIGKLRLKEKKYDNAKKYFKQVLGLNAFYPKAHFYLGQIAFIKKDYDEAIQQAQLEVQSHPRFLPSYLLAGRSYEKKQNFLKCSAEYQKAIELSPKDSSLYVKSARCYRKSGYLDLAQKILKKASDGGGDGSSSGLKSGDPLLYKELGVVYELKGVYNEAIRSYCNYLKLLPGARDRKNIEQKMKKIARLTGEKIKGCI